MSRSDQKLNYILLATYNQASIIVESALANTLKVVVNLHILTVSWDLLNNGPFPCNFCRSGNRLKGRPLKGVVTVPKILQGLETKRRELLEGAEENGNRNFCQ